MRRYLSRVPRQDYPPGTILVHNHVLPAHPVNLNGFRIWVTDENLDNYTQCKCGWAGHLTHYRVKSRPRLSPTPEDVKIASTLVKVKTTTNPKAKTATNAKPKVKVKAKAKAKA